MNDCPISRIRGFLLDLKRKEPSKAKRIEIAEYLRDLDEIERTAPAGALERWKRIHGPNWTGTEREQRAIHLGITKGIVTREDTAMILSDANGVPASRATVRQFWKRLRASLEEAGATATVEDAGRDGVYRTHVLTFRTLGEV
jgi:hypothetical protein